MRHDILGGKFLGLSPNSPTWKNILRQSDVPWLKDHKLGGAVVFRGAGHFSLPIEAYLQIHGVTPEELDSISLRDVRIIVLDTDDGIEIHTRLTKPSDESDLYKFSAKSVSGNIWTVHTEGFITKVSRQDSAGWPHHPKALHRKTQPKRWYEAFNRVGFAYGPPFQTMGPLRSNGRQHAAAATVRIQRNLVSWLESPDTSCIQVPLMNVCMLLLLRFIKVITNKCHGALFLSTSRSSTSTYQTLKTAALLATA